MSAADRALLELAAKAGGIKHQGYSDCACGDMYHPRDGESGLRIDFDDRGGISDNSGAWNPLADDGDALRLARALCMTIAHEPSRGGWSVGAIVNGEFKWLAHDDDQRRAIVLAAAAVGRAMP